MHEYRLIIIFLVVSRFFCSGHNECQDLSNPACPYNYKNTMPDYQDGNSVHLSDGLRTFMESNMATYLDLVVNNRPPGKFDAATVFEGLGGRALMYLRLYDRTKDKTYLDTAQDYIDSALLYIDTIPNEYVGFLWGKTGVYCVAAVLYSLRGDEDGSKAMIQQVQNIFDKASDDSYAKYDDFDSGRAGLLYAANFLKEYFSSESEVITRSSIVAVANATVQRGKALSTDPNKSYLEWISPNDGGRWLGQSHGSAGVLCQLLNIEELLQPGSESLALITATVDHIVSKQFPSGNFPSEYYSEDQDVLVQWDHGSPGVQGMLGKASIVLKNNTYLSSAMLAADCTWERGLVTKGLMLCHGIMGNTYMQIYLYKLTGNLRYIDRALKFQEFVAKTPELSEVGEMRVPTPNPYSMYTGSWESAIMLWADLLSVVNDDFMNLTMPCYEPGV